MPDISRPTSDINTGGFLTSAGGTANLYDEINDTVLDESNFIRKVFIGEPSGEPPRVIGILFDDLRDDDHFAKMVSGPRVGEYCMQQIRDRVMYTPLTTYFPFFRSGYGLCGPCRGEYMTGNYYLNHGVENGIDSYYRFYREGRPTSRNVDGASVIQGPWEIDYAKQYGLPDSPIGSGASQLHPGDSFQPFVGGKRAGNKPANTNDDLQAFTGMLPNWLAQYGITCIGVGKWENGYGSGTIGYSPPSDDTSRFVPPGWTHWSGVTGDDRVFEGDNQDHFHNRRCEYHGPNSGEGNGAVGVERRYDYDWTISSITHSAGKAIVSVTASAIGYYSYPGGTITPDLEVGDSLEIRGVGGVDNYNVTDAVVSDIDDDNTFRFVLTGPPLAPGSLDADSKVYFRKWFSDFVDAKFAIDSLEEVTDDEPFFLWFQTRMPHADVEGGGVEREVRYTDTVRPDNLGNTQFNHWAGGPGCMNFIDTITWSGGKATVTLSDPFQDPDGNAESLLVGDKIFVYNVDTVDAYNGTWLISDIVSDTVFKFIIAGPLSAGDTNPYSSLGAAVQVRRFISPAIPDYRIPVKRSLRRLVYAERCEETASTDDAVGQVLDYCESRGWTNVIVFLLSDNGFAYEEHYDTEGADTLSSVGAKGWTFESSVRLPCYVYNYPGFTPGISLINIADIDFPMTIMDIFSPWAPTLSIHHAHTKRDGYSWIRLYNNPLDPIHKRGILCLGKYNNVNQCTAIVTKNQMKYLHNPYTVGNVPHNLYDLHDSVLLSGDSLDRKNCDWETDDLIGDDPVFDTKIAAALIALQSGRWRPDLGRNTCRDALDPYLL